MALRQIEIPSLARRIQSMADSRGMTPREVMIAWMLSRPFPVIAILNLPSLLARSAEYARGSQTQLDFQGVEA